MIPRDLSKDIKTRLQSINGQLSGLIKMLDEDTDPEKILIQFKAAQKGLDKAHFLLDRKSVVRERVFRLV